MNNTEIVFLQESLNKRNAMGFRKIQVRKNTYDALGNVKSKILKTFDTNIEAEQWMATKGI
jgi:hypothetical protein